MPPGGGEWIRGSHLTGEQWRRRGGSVEHGGTDPAPLIRVEILFDRIDVALLVLRQRARAKALIEGSALVATA